MKKMKEFCDKHNVDFGALEAEWNNVGTVIGTEDAIGDLPELTPGEDGSSYPYKFPASNAYQKFMRGEIDAEEYLKTYKE